MGYGKRGDFIMVDDICALATPYGTSAIAIIRCSGPHAIELVSRIFKGKNLMNVKSHTIHFGTIYDHDEIIDEVLCNIFKAPHSFDGENTVEINCHGGSFVQHKLLQLLLKSGFRLAEPGEFSKRAFLNNRLDLTQAEAIMDIISSQNEIALKASQQALKKSTSALIEHFRNRLLDVLAQIEVNIDYPEYEDSIEVTIPYLKPILEEMILEMNEILSNSEISKIAIHGIKTAIVGKPNVGKSSLLNMLLEEDKAIVSDIPGTTRDLVEGSLNIGNVTLHLIDTAGIHESDDLVEKIGIKRSSKAIEDADLIFLVLDISNELDELDQTLLHLTKDKNRIIIANKSDIRSCWNLDEMIPFSTIRRDGLEALRNKLLEVTMVDALNIEEAKFLGNQRQIDLMKQAMQALKQALYACELSVDIDLIELDIKQAFEALGTITGQAYPDELITALFSKFCLGK